MRNVLAIIVVLVALTAPSVAQEAPKESPPIVNLNKIERAFAQVLRTAEEDATYFRGKTTRMDREREVLVKQVEMSIADSTPDMRIVYILTVYTSDKQCYGYCVEKFLPQEKPEEPPTIILIIRPFPPVQSAALLGGGFLL